MELTQVESTVMVIRSDLEHLREGRARAKSFARIMGEDGIELTFPDSFISSRLGDIKGTMLDVSSGTDQSCSLFFLRQFAAAPRAHGSPVGAT